MYGDGTKPRTTVGNRPMPVVTPLNRPFWEMTRRSVFSIQTCRSCGDKHIPESPVCPRCLSNEQEWQRASGRGTLESWADFHRAYWDGFVAELPYRVCLVRLAEGPLFVSNLVGDQDGLKLGMPLRAVFMPLTDEIALPVFEIV